MTSEKQTMPYGSWVSPITGDLIVSDAVRFGGVKAVSGFLYFSEMRPVEKGRSTLMRRTQEGHFEELLPSPYNARTRVHEYGGGAVLIEGNAIYFSNDADQQLYRVDAKGEIHPLTHEKNSRFADGCYDPVRKNLFYVLEVHGEKVENCLAQVNPETGFVRRVAEGHDFYSSPRVSPDGKYLAYICWDHPNMPWDGSELHLAEIKSDGSLGASKVIAGSSTESINQPSWGPDGLLYFISDRSGWWNLYRQSQRKIEPLCPMAAEFAEPQWVFGQTTYTFWGKDRMVCVYFQNGSEILGVFSLKAKKMETIELPFSSIQALSIAGDHLYFIGGSPSSFPSLVEYDLKQKKWEILKKSREHSLNPSYFSTPQTIEFPTEEGLTAHAFYYPPQNPHFEGMPGQLPPLIVRSHGGPTAHVMSLLNLEIQYWTSRGIAVLDVNYGGSSGYGRAYRARLKGKWGIVDVDDCVNGALWCAKKGLVDRNRMAIQGGSAGGYTTLAALTFRDVFKAGASFFGVSDLEALALDTHKFESKDLDNLIGPYPAGRNLYVERSPIHHVEKIHCPIILLQGAEDAIVPPLQSEKMYKSLVARKIPTAYLLFEKEQHGFRQAANIKRAIEATAYFYSKIFGFSLADSIEPVPIANFDEL